MQAPESGNLRQALTKSPQTDPVLPQPSLNGAPIDMEEPRSAKLSQAPENINWSTDYALPGINNLAEENSAIRLRIKELQTQISVNEQIVYFLDAVKVPLLTGDPNSLMESCKAILENFGWPCEDVATGKK